MIEIILPMKKLGVTKVGGIEGGGHQSLHITLKLQYIEKYIHHIEHTRQTSAYNNANNCTTEAANNNCTPDAENRGA